MGGSHFWLDSSMRCITFSESVFIFTLFFKHNTQNTIDGCLAPTPNILLLDEHVTPANNQKDLSITLKAPLNN